MNCFLLLRMRGACPPANAAVAGFGLLNSMIP